MFICKSITSMQTSFCKCNPIFAYLLTQQSPFYKRKFIFAANIQIKSLQTSNVNLSTLHCNKDTEANVFFKSYSNCYTVTDSKCANVQTYFCIFVHLAKSILQMQINLCSKCTNQTLQTSNLNLSNLYCNKDTVANVFLSLTATITKIANVQMYL